ncbi:MAG: type I DNA topoisomerase, partial [Nocardioides sp.]
MAHKLVIVESPAKARTIGGYLGQGYVVESSIGHIRDLPNSAADTPAKIKDKPWGRLAVDVDNGFEPYYVVPRDKKSHISKLKGLLKDADELYLATDEDREGEAIAWHLLDELKPKNIPVKRMVFHEITKAAILEAADNPRELAMDLVEAQETRRILDRLYGYEVSPVLWKKVMSGLSAGRVQSVATRLVVDREKERMAFKVASYWDLEGTFDAGSKHEQRMFPAKLHSVDEKRVARGTDFGQDGVLKASAEGKVVHLDRPRAEALVAALEDTTYDVRSVEAKPYRRSPYPPFRTTTLQQEASRKLGMSASVTMSVAQRLYENGYITYMRTDSTTLSGTAVNAARSQVRELYGAEYLPDTPRTYTSKVKNAQEAHEAIRPAGESFRTPAQTGLTGEQFRLYELIWMRTVASQMKDAVGQSVTIRLGGAAATGEDVVFSATGRVITFHGFLKAYVEGTDEGKQTDDQE